jgi:peptide/nickel transport system substrate-binding protein
MKRSVVPFVALTAAALALTACAGGGGGGDDTSSGAGALRVAFEALPESWDPADAPAGYWGAAVYENLLSVGPGAEQELSPQLATEWTVEDAAIVFSLRDDVEFHDGTPFNAEAVKANLDHTFEVGGRFAARLGSIESAEVVDEYTVQFNLKRSDPSLLRVLAGAAGWMASPAAIEDDSITTHPVGTSPWSYDPEASIEGGEQVFNLIDDYWGGEVEGRPGQVIISPVDDPQSRVNALTAGDADIADVAPNLYQVAIDAGMEADVYDGVPSSMMIFDRAPGGVLGDIDVRRAICSAINPEDVALALGEINVAQEQKYTEGSPFHVEDLDNYPYDPEAAKAYLEAAGNPSITLNMATFPGNSAGAEVVQAALSEIGIEVTLESQDAAQFFGDWNSGKYSIGLSGVIEPHPASWYSVWFAQDGRGNPSAWEPEALISAGEAARAAGISDGNELAWQEVANTIYSEALTCFDISLVQVNGYDPAVVTDVQAPDFEGGTLDYHAVRMVD